MIRDMPLRACMLDQLNPILKERFHRRTVSVFTSNLLAPYVSMRSRIRLDQAPPRSDRTSAVVRCIVVLTRTYRQYRFPREPAYPAHPSSRARISPPSMTCMNFRWFKFPCSHLNLGCRCISSSPSPQCGGSTTLSSNIHASRPPPFDPMPGSHLAAQLGRMPRFRSSRVVWSRPIGSMCRESTSTDMTCRAKGLG